MATDDPVAYVNAEKDGRFSFYRADGSEVVVAQKPYETDDPIEIAYLDSVEFVKRAAAKSGGKD
jgi:hypothetical protein